MFQALNQPIIFIKTFTCNNNTTYALYSFISDIRSQGHQFPMTCRELIFVICNFNRKLSSG